MSEHDAINTIRTLPASLHYNIEMGVYVETFTGTDSTSWFWALMNAIQTVIQDWQIKTPPKFIRIAVRREVDDKGPYPWMTVVMLKVHGFEAPWIDLDELEQKRDYYFMLGQALGLAWRNRDARAIVTKFKPEIPQDD